MVQPLWKIVWRFLKQWKINLPYDPAIALLGIYPKYMNVVIQRGMCIPMFIAAICTIAKLWKEPRCPSIVEWTKKMWYIFIQLNIMHLPKSEILSFAMMWMELEGIMLS